MSPRVRRITDAPDAIKRAVKEALDDKWKDDTTKQMTSLATQMTEGFTSVHTRQDTANGKLSRHEAAITKLQEERQADDAVKEKQADNRSRLKWLSLDNLIQVMTTIILAYILIKLGLK